MALRPLPTPQTRYKLEELLKKKFFYAPAFSIYGGVAGLFDYGPPGCALQANIVNAWKSHFILEEGMLEVDTTILTPYDVLKSSGHVDRFSDWMAKDVVTGDVYRADHLLKATLNKIISQETAPLSALSSSLSLSDSLPWSSIREQATKDLCLLDGFSGKELEDRFNFYQIKSDLGNDLSPLAPFNLMFKTDIGPAGNLCGFLRPETAQGQFVNFKRLLEFNNDKMPFASAQIGKSFRNEISPRSGLLRVREFLMAEIEHFVHPQKKDHPKFSSVSNVVLPLLSKQEQKKESDAIVMMAIGTAIAQKTVDNETLGYFMVRIYMFLIQIGIQADKIRFRQHQSNEMAHYASDCWDAEILTSYGWIECVGCADRSAYDLTVHSAKTKEKLVARERLSEPTVVTRLVANLDNKSAGMAFKRDAKTIDDTLASLSEETLLCMKKDLQENGKCHLSPQDGGSAIFEIPSTMLSIETVTEKVHVLEYIPSVVEPSFGLGRIMYSLLEHVYWVRPSDDQRSVLSLPPLAAPIKLLVVPLLSQDAFDSAVEEVARSVRCRQLAVHVDTSSTSVGRKYSRSDELGTPFVATVDHRSLEDHTVTMRERDTTGQIRIPISEVGDVLEALVKGSKQWKDALVLYENVNAALLQDVQ